MSLVQWILNHFNVTHHVNSIIHAGAVVSIANSTKFSRHFSPRLKWVVSRTRHEDLIISIPEWIGFDLSGSSCLGVDREQAGKALPVKALD